MMGLVMQEHTLFNYNITENILYEKMEATNTELRESAKVANALEFIENDQLSIFEDEAEALIGYMEQY
jgi:ABC-type multidrug transport system fused ATPase/permease subunit